MNFQSLFFSPNGRIGQQAFWIGFLILFVLHWLVHLVPILGQIVAVVMIYCWICLYSKRLHDMGKSGWLQLIPILAWIVAIVAAVVMGGTAILTGMFSGGGEDGAAVLSALAGAGMIIAPLCVAFLVGLVFLLWVGLSRGDPGDNRFGPPAGKAAPAPA